MARAAKTWDPSGKYWEAGGGGTAWDTFAFDPSLLMIGVGVVVLIGIGSRADGVTELAVLVAVVDTAVVLVLVALQMFRHRREDAPAVS